MDAQTIDEVTKQIVANVKRVEIICVHCGAVNRVHDISNKFYCIECRKMNIIIGKRDPRETQPI